jgi:hypothetical protein
MPDLIKDGTGQGYYAGVNFENRLMVTAKTESLQHLISQDYGQAYQAIGTATLASGRVTVLHLKNTSSDKNMVVTYIRHQVVGATGGTAFPNALNYFEVSGGRTYLSGGDLKVPVNVNRGSGNLAEAIVYNGSPVLTGTESEIDRWYTQSDGDMNTLNKEGSLIVQPNNTIELSYTGDQTAGIIYTRVSFLMERVA